MFISSIRFYHFRNLADLEIRPGAGINFLVGKNGHGKTNFIEALNLLSIGRSFRSASTEELIRLGDRSASIFAVVANNQGAETISQEIGLKLEEGRKEAYANGEKLPSVGDIFGKLITVTFSPNDLFLIKGAPQLRRSFLDRHISEYKPAFFKVLLAYQRALKSKQTLLKQKEVNAEQLHPWEKLMAENAIVICRERVEFIKKLQVLMQEAMTHLAPSDGSVNLQYKSNAEEPSSVKEEEFMTLFEKYRKRELAFKNCLVGPHRDDLMIQVGGLDARAFASQGQARSLTLALKLGVTKLLRDAREEEPVLLLDDVDSELDEARSKALYDLVFSENRQVFITGTKLPALSHSKLGSWKEMHVTDGIILA